MRVHRFDRPRPVCLRDFLIKKRLKSDPEVQLFEDAICLTFVENQLADFADKHDDAKLIDVLRKTWAKMTSAGHQQARALLDRLPQRARELMEAALAGDD